MSFWCLTYIKNINKCIREGVVAPLWVYKGHKTHYLKLKGEAVSEWGSCSPTFKVVGQMTVCPPDDVHNTITQNLFLRTYKS